MGQTNRVPNWFFFVSAMFGAMVLAVVGYTIVWPEFRAASVYVPQICTVLAKKIEENRGDEGTSYYPSIQIRYVVGGRRHETWTYRASRVFASGRDNAE